MCMQYNPSSRKTSTQSLIMKSPKDSHDIPNRSLPLGILTVFCNKSPEMISEEGGISEYSCDGPSAQSLDTKESAISDISISEIVIDWQYNI